MKYCLLLFLFLSGCNVPERKVPATKRNPFDLEHQNRGVEINSIILGRMRNLVTDTGQVYDEHKLVGKWMEEAIWERDSSGWTGIKTTRFHHTLEFTKSNKFIYTEINSDSSLEWMIRGICVPNKEGDSLELWTTFRNDTIYKPGDPVIFERRKPYLLNDSVFKVEGRFKGSSKSRVQIVEYRKSR